MYLYGSINIGVHITPVKAWAFRGLSRCIINSNGWGFLTETRSSLQWRLWWFRWPTHVRVFKEKLHYLVMSEKTLNPLGERLISLRNQSPSSKVICSQDDETINPPGETLDHSIEIYQAFRQDSWLSLLS